MRFTIQDKVDMNTHACNWAFFHDHVGQVFPTGYGGNNVEPGEDKNAYSFILIEDAIAAFVRGISATPGYARYWRQRVRPAMLCHFRDGKEITDAERGIIGKILGKAAKIHDERNKVFEDAA